MGYKVRREDIIEAVSRAKFAERVRLSAGEVYATSQLVTLKATFPVDGKGAPEVYETKALLAALGRITTETVSFAGDGKFGPYKLRTQSADDYPERPFAGGTKIVAPKLPEQISRVIRCSSTDETRAHLNAVLFEWAPGSLRLVATDGHRLAIADGPAEAQGAGCLLLPLSGVKLIDGATAFTSEGAFDDLSIAKVEAQFPPYNQVDSPAKHALTVKRDALVGAIRAAMVVGDRLELAIGRGKLAVSAKGEPGEASAEIECSADKAAKIGVNPKYMIDALSPSGEVANIGFTGELDPLVVTEEGYRCVVMPMRI